MEKRVMEKDAISLGLLYTYMFSNYRFKTLSKEALINFKNEIEKNLEEMDSKENLFYKCRLQNMQIYDAITDANGNEFYSLNDSFNLPLAVDLYIESAPKDHISASVKSNALNAIGLAYHDGKIVEASSIQKSNKRVLSLRKSIKK